ncbi:MAG TPA: MBL fold metallo-hydrolase [Candidatus Methylacidiphilales bacterium]|nr:MBL fold metallo-hydrolase [Candidatus Methylacidiphilales bacterium]
MRLHPILLFLLLGLGPVAAQSSSETNAPPRALPVDSAAATNLAPRALPVSPADLNGTQTPMAVPGGVNIHWYGHGFVYLTSSVGIRAAIDPFGPNVVHYKFPEHLEADFVLVTHEADDHCAADLIFGNPLIFRSVMAVGLNRANGIPFYGVALQKDPSGDGAANTAFTLTFDGVKFCYPGQINMPLLAQEKAELGKVDVIFLPVGLETLSVGDLNQVVKDLGATVVIPINYKTDLSGIVPLRTLDEYLSVTKFPVRKFDSDEIVINRAMLPAQPTVYILKSPMEPAPAPPSQ